MMQNVLLVGEAPGKGGRLGGPVLLGRIGRRLARLMGATEDQYRRRTRRVNLLTRWPGRASGNGSAWPVKRARRSARRMEDAGLFAPPDRIVILLGRRVAAAFGLGGAPWFTSFQMASSQGMPAEVVVAPHPSGASRWWNEPANVARARRFWRSVGRRVGEV